MKLILQSFKANLSQQQIMNMIDPDELAKIKENDEHPYFQAFSICHEGESRPKVLNGKTKPIKWFKAAVQSLKDIALKGINFFKRHNKDNSTDGRKSIGRVVGHGEVNIDGILNHIAVAYHPPNVKEEASNCDVCSMEAFWDLVDHGNEYIAQAAERITGIALSNSNIETPAFPGAVKLGMVQAFESAEESQNKERRMTFADVKSYVRENEIPVWKLYGKEDIYGDKAVQKIINERDKLQEELTNSKAKIEELTTSNNTLSKEKKLLTIDSRLKSIVDKSDTKPTEKQRDFITKKFEKIKSRLTDDQLSDDGLKQFVESAIGDYKMIVQTNETQKPENPTNVSPQNNKDFTKAENNELLNEDL